MSFKESLLLSQTRSGRVSQLPKRMTQDYEVKWLSGGYLKSENNFKKQADLYETIPSDGQLNSPASPNHPAATRSSFHDHNLPVKGSDAAHTNGNNLTKRCYVKLIRLDLSKITSKNNITQISEGENNNFQETVIQKLVQEVKEESRSEFPNVVDNVQADIQPKEKDLDELVSFFIKQYNENSKNEEAFCGLKQYNEDEKNSCIKGEIFCEIKQENEDFEIEKKFYVTKQEMEGVKKEEGFWDIKQECDDLENKADMFRWVKKEEEMDDLRNEDGLNDSDTPMEFPREKHKLDTELELTAAEVTKNSSQGSGIPKPDAGSTNLVNNQEGNEEDSFLRRSTLRSWKNSSTSSSNDLMNTSSNDLMNISSNDLMNTSSSHLMNTSSSHLMNTPSNDLMNTSSSHLMNTPSNQWIYSPVISSSSIMKKDSDSVVFVDNVFLCPKCDYKVSNSGLISRHVKKEHNIDKAFVCKVCNYRSGLHSNLRIHYKVTHRQKSFKCGQCKYTASNVILLNIHCIKAHSKEEPHKCVKCSYSTSKLHFLRIHFRLHNATKKEGKGKKVKKEKKERKEKKEIKVKREKKMKKEKKERKGRKEIKVKREKKVKKEKKVRTKIKVNKKKKDIKVKKMKKTYCCSACNYFTTQVTTFRKHIAMHVRQKKSKTHLELSVKEKHTNNGIADEKHREEKKNEALKKKSYTCNICRFTTSHPSLLITHTILHSSEHTELRERIQNCFK